MRSAQKLHFVEKVLSSNIRGRSSCGFHGDSTMVASRTWGFWLALWATVGLCLPIASVSAAEPAQTARVSERAARIRDVELGYGGLLVGRLLDANGRPQKNAGVSFLSDGHTLASTRTDVEGVFAVAKLRGGVREITTADDVQVCRLWANGTAPPQTPRSIDMVSGEDVVRGQWGPPPGNRLIQKAKVWATNPFVIGGVVAAAVALPIALSDDNGPHS